LIALFNRYAPKAGLQRISLSSSFAEKQTARKLLGYFEDRAAPELLELLATPFTANRMAALQALAELGPAVAPLAGPQLVPLLNDPDDAIVFETITTLAVIGYDPGSVVPRLVPFLEHGNDRVRLEAAYAIGSYPPLPAITLDPLIAALQDPDKVVRANAARALGGLGREAGPALEALGEHLDADPLVVARAVEAIAMIVGKDATALGDAFETAHAAQLAGQDRYNQLMVLRASHRLGRPVNELEAVADALLASPSNWQVWEAVDALAELEPRPAWAGKLLERATRHSNGLVRARARTALEK
jgi:HEAT repeat protein